MLEAYARFFRNYINFEGRANRAEYWWIVLWNVIVFCICLFLGLGGFIGENYGAAGFGAVLFWAYQIATLIPSISITVRRLHDSDKTGWLFLVVFIPYIGWLIIFVLMLLGSTQGPNRYGEPSDF